ncbi:MAG: hypothetical protein KDA20_00080 [Phycisphaerales bacterium]|nr:hypothetical protein [Phycisphaerales bacterium]
MRDQEFDRKLGELLSQIETLPEDQRAALEEMAEETKSRRARVQGAIKGLQESLDHLRLSVKYLVFDLEATRRENAYLRRMLDEGKAQDNDE